jgi:hypothetical protein
MMHRAVLEVDLDLLNIIVYIILDGAKRCWDPYQYQSGLLPSLLFTTIRGESNSTASLIERCNNNVFGT